MRALRIHIAGALCLCAVIFVAVFGAAIPTMGQEGQGAQEGAEPVQQPAQTEQAEPVEQVDQSETPPRPSADALPENTVFYFLWNPTHTLGDLRETNPLLSLFNSEEMQINWVLVKDYFSQMVEALTELPGENRREKTEGKDEFAEFWEEFETEEVRQFVRSPGIMAVVLPSISVDDIDVEEPTLLFAWHLDYDSFVKALTERGDGKTKRLRKYKRKGLRVESYGSSKKEEEFWLAQVGPWVAGGTRQELAQEWMLALRDGEARLGGLNSFRRAAEWRNESSQVEMYFNLAETLEFAEVWDQRKPETEKKPGDFDIELDKIFTALGLKDWQAFLFSVALEDERAQLGLSALYADERSDTPSVLAEPVRDFGSLGFAPPETLAYSVTHMNLGAVWEIADRAMRLLLPPQQVRWAFGVRGMIEGMMGVSIRDLANSWGPEYAQVIYIADEADNEDDAKKAEAEPAEPCTEDDAPGTCVTDLGLRNLYAMHVNDPDLILTVVRNLLPMFAGQLEVSEQEIEVGTLFEVKRSGEGVETLREFAALLTPDWLMFGSNRIEIERALERASAGPALGEAEAYQIAREHFPVELTSFSFDNVDLWLESGKLETVLQEAGRGIAYAARQQVVEQRARLERERTPEPEEETESKQDDEAVDEEDPAEETDKAADKAADNEEDDAAEGDPSDAKSSTGRNAWPGKGAQHRTKGDGTGISSAPDSEEMVLIEEDFLLLEFPRLVIPAGFLRWISSGTTRDQYGIHHVTIIE